MYSTAPPVGSAAGESHRGWIDAFERLRDFDRTRFAPGHREVGPLSDFEQPTLDYLKALKTHMDAETEEGTRLQDAIEGLDQSPLGKARRTSRPYPGATRTRLIAIGKRRRSSKRPQTGQTITAGDAQTGCETKPSATAASSVTTTASQGGAFQAVSRTKAVKATATSEDEATALVQTG